MDFRLVDEFGFYNRDLLGIAAIIGLIGFYVGISLKRGRWIDPPPQMPTWYWVISWTVWVVGVVLWWWIPYRLYGGLWLGATALILVPLVWKKAPPKTRPWVTLFLVALATVLLVSCSPPMSAAGACPQWASYSFVRSGPAPRLSGPTVVTGCAPHVLEDGAASLSWYPSEEEVRLRQNSRNPIP